MKKIIILLMLILDVAYSVHPRLFFNSYDVTSNRLYTRRTIHSSLELFYNYLKDNAWNNRYSTLNSRDKAHYASDMAFIAAIDLSLSSPDRAILKTRAINQLSNIYNFAPDGSGYEGVFYSMFGLCPILAYYEALRRDDPSKNMFTTTNFRYSAEWLAMELIPAPARDSGIPESLFDFSNVNAAYFSNYLTGGAI
jgi:hypothetical protein